MAKTRRDSIGRTLQKGESYLSDRKLYRFSYTDPIGTRRYIYSKDLLVLRDKEKEIWRDSLDGIDSYARAKCTLNFLFERHLATKTNLRSTTRANYIYMYDRYVRQTLGQKRVGDIKYSDILYLYQSQLDKGYSISTIENIHRPLYSALKMGVRDDIIRKNPAEGVLAEIKSSHRSDKSKHALTYAEEKAFLECLERPENARWRSLFTFMLGTGCRVSEVIGIRWDDIDFEAREISINHDVTYYPREKQGFKCRYEVAPPKTEAGNRIIPMMSKVRDVLLEEKRQQDELGIQNHAVIDGMTGFIFCNRNNELNNPSTINRAIKRIVNDHNRREVVRAAKEDREPVIIPSFSCHIMRHTFCTRLCENGTNIKLIQQIMGHADIRTTMDIYAEVTKAKAQSVFQELHEEDVL